MLNVTLLPHLHHLLHRLRSFRSIFGAKHACVVAYGDSAFDISVVSAALCTLLNKEFVSEGLKL